MSLEKRSSPRSLLVIISWDKEAGRPSLLALGVVTWETMMASTPAAMPAWKG